MCATLSDQYPRLLRRSVSLCKSRLQYKWSTSESSFPSRENCNLPKTASIGVKLAEIVTRASIQNGEGSESRGAGEDDPENVKY